MDNRRKRNEKALPPSRSWQQSVSDALSLSVPCSLSPIAHLCFLRGSFLRWPPHVSLSSCQQFSKPKPLPLNDLINFKNLFMIKHRHLCFQFYFPSALTGTTILSITRFLSLRFLNDFSLFPLIITSQHMVFILLLQYFILVSSSPPTSLTLISLACVIERLHNFFLVFSLLFPLHIDPVYNLPDTFPRTLPNVLVNFITLPLKCSVP